MSHLRRREFITLLGGAAAWPLAARAQKPMPVIGLLGSASPDTYARSVAAFREGLKSNGLVEDKNVMIEYRWAQDRHEQLPGLAADLVRHNVAVICAIGGGVSALAAKAATQKIPIVFVNGSDPVKNGLAASINRPGGNVTGISLFSVNLEAKRIELLRELIPKATIVAVLVNPRNLDVDLQLKGAQAATAAGGQQLLVLEASSERDFDSAFATIVQQRADALFVATDPLFQSRVDQIVALAASNAVPTMYAGRASIPAGGLITYGADVEHATREAAAYVARILKGEKPNELPIQLPTKFELVINLKTAKALGLKIPDKLLALANEVIE
jgi:putative ABC transport system substrate-binding protein